jgi:peptidoglycan lytic transglycosylase
MNTTRARSSLLVAVMACISSSTAISASQTEARSKVATETGIAIFYSDKMQGKPVTSGEKYDKNALTAAHRTLPLGTMVKVTNLKNNRSIVVKINDRGPHGSKERIIDLSGRAALDLDMIKDGKAKVKLEVVESAGK